MWLVHRGGCFSASPQEGAYMCGLYTEVAALVLLPRRVRMCMACTQRWLLYNMARLQCFSTMLAIWDRVARCFREMVATLTVSCMRPTHLCQQYKTE